MNDPLILDTCAFSDKDFLYKLRKYHGRKILPAVAYSELCAHYVKNKKKNPQHLDRLLNQIDIEVDQLDKLRAQYAALYSKDGKDFKLHHRDYLIGAHAFPPPRKMITINKKDFWFLNNVYTPEEISKKF